MFKCVTLPSLGSVGMRKWSTRYVVWTTCLLRRFRLYVVLPVSYSWLTGVIGLRGWYSIHRNSDLRPFVTLENGEIRKLHIYTTYKYCFVSEVARFTEIYVKRKRDFEQTIFVVIFRSTFHVWNINLTTKIFIHSTRDICVENVYSIHLTLYRDTV